MPPSLSFVVPTKGRPTLPRTLATIASQIEPGDEILVVCTNDNDWGNAARQSAQDRAKGDYLAYMDDDDIFLPGAIATMRSWAAANSGKIGVFKRKSDAWPTQWHEPVLRLSNVAPPMFLIPNVSGRVARWGEISEDAAQQARLDQAGRGWSDAMLIEETARLQGAEVVFVDVVTSYAQPTRSPLRRWRYQLRLGNRVRALRESFSGGRARATPR